MLQTSNQPTKHIVETDAVKSLMMVVKVTNDSLNGFQASVQVMPAAFRQRFSSIEELAQFLLKIQHWEHMQLPVQTE
jgi:hypothetical protein